MTYVKILTVNDSNKNHLLMYKRGRGEFRKLIVAKFRVKFLAVVPLLYQFYSREICVGIKTDTWFDLVKFI